MFWARLPLYTEARWRLTCALFFEQVDDCHADGCGVTGSTYTMRGRHHRADWVPRNKQRRASVYRRHADIYRAGNSMGWIANVRYRARTN